MTQTSSNTGLNRRQFLKSSGAVAAATGLAAPTIAAGKGSKPNFIFIVCDQLGFDALSAQGCPDVQTPNLDRLMARGTSFQLGQSSSPVCSPARSSMFTGRMPVETGVVTNSLSIHPSLPTMGSWFRKEGYQTAYCGKWHLPHGYPRDIKGFEILHVGGGQGDICDRIVSRSCEAFLRKRQDKRPFVLVSSLLQPHDICYWAIHAKHFVPEELAFPQLAGKLPKLPPNHNVHPKAPTRLANSFFRGFSNAEQWQYYIHVYYRMVEMLDADVGRILRAVEESGQAEDTIIIFTSDHGEGRGRHNHVQKWYPYEEAMAVPFFVSCPGRLPTKVRDSSHLVSHVDILPTMCELAGIKPPPTTVGRSFAPLLEGKAVEWRDHLVCEAQLIGRMVRTERYKFVRYKDDPVVQLFDMKDDPWETKNLAEQARFADTIRDHERLLKEWNARITPAPGTKDPFL
jgi:arylsulfatase A-like enzyme